MQTSVNNKCQPGELIDWLKRQIAGTSWICRIGGPTGDHVTIYPSGDLPKEIV